MTLRIADQAAGALQGASDAAAGSKHRIRAGHAEAEPPGRTEAAQARWHAGLDARNQFERDVFLSMEPGPSVRADQHLDHARKAAELEAAMRAESGMAPPEAGG